WALRSGCSRRRRCAASRRSALRWGPPGTVAETTPGQPGGTPRSPSTPYHRRPYGCSVPASYPHRVVGVYLETGTKRVFACALDWPGWCRSAKNAGEALDQLAAYTPRYAPVAAHAALKLPAGAAGALDVVDKVRGSATT